MNFDGTTYHDDTPEHVIFVLEWARRTGTRVRLFYGDRKTGRDWGEENSVTGTVGRSTGTVKIPLLISRSNALGGLAILDNCIVRIIASGGPEAYRHPLYQEPVFHIEEADQALRAEGYQASVMQDNYQGTGGPNIANFHTRQQAERWIDFMMGRRMGK